MRIGQLDRRAEIIAFSEARNAYNEPAREPTVIATVWCSIRGTPGREFMAASQLIAEERAVMTIRYRAGLDAANAVRVEGREWNIHSVRELGRREYLEISATFTR